METPKMKIQWKALPVLTPIAAVVLGGFSCLAHAQANETEYNNVLEEVIVTAQKREQSLQEVPIAVTAFSGEFLDKAGITDVFQMQSVAPSLKVSQSQSVASTNFSIRGFGTSSNSYGFESAVGLFVDGVYQSRGSTLANEMVDIASVEVLRGPQGTLFGRNTAAGAVSFYSVRPDHEGSGFLELTAGNYDLYAASGAKSFSVVPDVLAMRATGFIKKRGGTVEDLNFGDVYNQDRWGARLQALYTPNEDVSVLFSVDYSDLDENCCGQGVILNNFEQLLVPPEEAGQGTDNRLGDFATVLLGEDFYDRKIVWPAPKLSSSQSGGALMEVTWQLDNVELFSLTSLREYETYDGFDNRLDTAGMHALEYDVLDAVYDTAEGELSAFSQEFRLSGETDKLIYVAGLFYFDQSFDTVASTFFGEEAAPFHVGLPTFFFPTDSAAINSAYQDQNAWAVFGQIDYTLTDDLILTAGLRYTEERKDVFINYENVNPGPGFPYQEATKEREDKTIKDDDSKTTGTLKLSWFANDDVMVYGSVSTGYKSSGLNLTRNDPIYPVVVDAEESTTYEIGVKADLVENTLRLNATVFYTDYDNFQTSGLSDIGFIWLNSERVASGLEIESNWLATDNLTLNLGYAYLDGKYGDFVNGGCWIFYTWHSGEPDPTSNGDGSCDNSDRGNDNHFLMVNGTYDVDLGADMSGYLYGEYSHNFGFQLSDDPVLKALQGDYGLLNLRAGLLLDKYNMELVAWMRNALDEEYVTGVQGTLMQDGKVLSYYRDPRTFGLTLRMFFN
jgi:iron complex outermembrane receptor protein